MSKIWLDHPACWVASASVQIIVTTRTWDERKIHSMYTLLRYCSCANNLFFQPNISARPMKEKRRMRYLFVRGIRRDRTQCLRKTQFDAFIDHFIDMYTIHGILNLALRPPVRLPLVVLVFFFPHGTPWSRWSLNNLLALLIWGVANVYVIAYVQFLNGRCSRWLCNV